MSDEELWRQRVLEERANELEEYKMTASQQVESQIERVSAELERQKIANQSHREHIKSLNKEIEKLKKIVNEIDMEELTIHFEFCLYI